MANFFDDEKRNMLPLWRSYDDIGLVREMEYTGRKTLPMRFDLYDSFTEAWKAKQTVVTAADLVNAAVASGNTHHVEVMNAADFMLNNAEQCTTLALEVATSIVNPTQLILPNSLSKPTKFEDIATNLLHKLVEQDQKTKARIGMLRRRLREHCYDPVAYCELARCYANLGMNDKAETYMNYAVYLAPSSRFIVRCAARFFVHKGDLDRAKSILLKSGRVKTDPWIMSAEIAVESVMERVSRYVKDGRHLALSGNMSAFSTSELCFAICKVDLDYGKRKDSRKMFEKGIIEPNDNSLAQAEFFAKRDSNMQLDLSAYNCLPHKHEADTRKAYVTGKFEDAFLSSLKWMQDYRFEQRPIAFAFDISCIYLKRYDFAIEVEKKALALNPKNPTAVNNLAYVMGLSDRLDEAETCLSSINHQKYLNDKDTTGAICLIATCGLLEYRKGNVDDGRKMYNMAIQTAKKHKENGLAAKARLNMIREEVHNVNDYDANILNELDSLETNSIRETEQLRKDIIEEVKKKS
ncbi:MAG: hypothetical protein IKH63_10870 [Prevotella sp.]|nr:hypothetical protein [Prevotella sp.]